MEYMAGGSVADLVGYFCGLPSLCSILKNFNAWKLKLKLFRTQSEF